MGGLRYLPRFARRVVVAFLKNRGILLAGGVGYNALLSLVPFLTLAVVALSRVFDEARVEGVLRRELTMLVPRHAEAILDAVAAFRQNPGGIGLVSVLVLLFFSSLAFRMLEEAVAAIFHTHTARHGASRSFWVSAGLPYLFMLLLMVALFVLTLVTSALDALADQTVTLFGWTFALAGGAAAALGAAGFGGLVLLFAGIYRALPVTRIAPRRALIGGFCAAVVWRGVSAAMGWYLESVSMLNLVYGSLATVIVLLVSLELAFIVLLLGAQVIAELEASAAAGLPWHEAPRHE